MNHTLARSAALGAALLTLGAAGLAQAQMPPPRGEGHPMMMGHERPDPAAMAARRTERLRAVLQLTPAQEPALAAFAAALKPPEEMGEKRRDEHEAMEKLSTPERLDRMRARMTEHLARMDQRIAATKAFYGQLTPAQKKAFDSLPMGGHGGQMGHPGGMGPGPR